MNACQNDKLAVAKLYDALAPRYEQEMAPRAHYEVAVRQFLAENVSVGSRVLDLGCGPGHLTRDLAPEVVVVGLDVSSNMLDEARRARLGRSGTYRVHDFHDALPADLGQFDVIVASSCFDFCEDVVGVIGNAAAALAPGGRFYFTIDERRPERRFHDERSIEVVAGNQEIRIFFWTFAETVAAIEAAGLRPSTYRHAPGWDSKHLETTIYYGYWVVERPLKGTS